MRSQYAATPNPAPPTLTTIAGTTTAASAKTYWCWIYARTRGGITGFSTSKTLAIASGQGLRVTIPAAVVTAAGEFLSIGVVLGVTDNPANGCVVASVSRSATYPANVDLTKDVHFGLNQSVLTVAALPNALNAINGMRRYVDATNKIVEYSSASNAWVNCLPQVFNPWVSSRLTEEPDGRRGADRDLADITDYSSVIIPQYATDGSLSDPVNYWIVNDGTTNVRQGTRIRLAIATDTFDSVSDDFKGLCQLSFLGYANTATGELDTSGMQLGTYDYQGDVATNLVTQKALLPGWAYAIAIRMRFSDYEINNRVSQGETVKVYPRFAREYSTYQSNGKYFGNCILNKGGLRRLIPQGVGLSLEAQSGEGAVGQFEFPLLEPQPVTGLAQNTANINIAIANDGTCYPTNATLPSDTADRRAIVSTLNGAGTPGSWSTTIALSPTTLLSISLTHSLIIRPDYPDVIAGTPATLNAGTIRVYVRIVGQTVITYFDVATLGLDETITVGSVATGNLTELPTPNQNFGLFAAPTVNSRTTQASSSVFTAGNYEFAVGYYYESTVTAITHSPSVGCIRELLTDVIDSLAIADSWGSVLALGTYATIDDAIRNAPIPSDGQVRNLDSRASIRSDSPLIYYNAFSVETERTTVGDRVWLPSGRNLATPGRWKTKVALTGPAGSQIFFGTANPLDTVGANTDFYVNTTTYDLFQKSGGIWTLQGNIKGATGVTPVISTQATTLNPAQAATAVTSGTPEAPLITLGIPRGVTPNISVQATTLSPGQPATAAVTGGTAAAPVITFGIPQGTPGSGLGGSSFSSILLDNQTALFNTTANQLNLINLNGILKTRLPNNGADYQLAFVEQASQNNLLLNGGFQIAQVATSFTLTAGTTFAYLLDHWQGLAGSAGAATVSQNSNNNGASSFLRWAQTTSATDAPMLRTRLERATTLAGQVTTVSFWAVATAGITIASSLVQSFGSGGTPSTAVSVAGGSFAITTTRQRFTFTVILPTTDARTFGTNNDSSLDLLFTLPIGATFQIDLDSIKLEPGAIASPFVTRPLDQLLLSARRYLYRLSGATGSLPWIGTGRANVANTATVPFLFSTPMRIIPTVTGNDLLMNAVTVTAINMGNNGGGINGCSVDFSATATAALLCMIKLNSANSFLQFDARMPLTA